MAQPMQGKPAANILHGASLFLHVSPVQPRIPWEPTCLLFTPYHLAYSMLLTCEGTYVCTMADFSFIRADLRMSSTRLTSVQSVDELMVPCTLCHEHATSRNT